MSRYKVAILGAGITGLKTALDILKLHGDRIESIDFFDSQADIGGVLQTTHENGYCFEHGAQGVLEKRVAFKKLVSSFSSTRPIFSAFNLKRYLFIKNNIFSIEFTFNNLKKLGIKKRDLIKLCINIVFHRFLIKNETLYGFFKKRIGKKLTEIFIIPFTYGVWGGGSKFLVLRHNFKKLYWLDKSQLIFAFIAIQLLKLIKNKMKPFFSEKATPIKDEHRLASFKGGMSVLCSEMYQEIKKISLLSHTKINFIGKTDVARIEKEPLLKKMNSHNRIERDNRYIISEFGCFDLVVYTPKPWLETSPKIIGYSIPPLPTHSLIVVGIGGDEKFCSPLKGFGGLFNEKEKGFLGVLFIDSIFKEHVPEGKKLFRVLLGGEKIEGIQSLNDDELIEMSKHKLEDLKLITKDFISDFKKVIRWNHYVPLYNEDFDFFLTHLSNIEKKEPGIFFAGNYTHGVGVNDCLRSAEAAVTKITNFLISRS